MLKKPLFVPNFLNLMQSLSPALILWVTITWKNVIYQQILYIY